MSCFFSLSIFILTFKEKHGSCMISNNNVCGEILHFNVFYLAKTKNSAETFLRKAGVSWKPTGENPVGLIHVHCISKENHLPKFRFRFIILIYKSTQNLFLVSVRKHKACFWIQGSILFPFLEETIEPLIVEQNNSVHASQFWTTGFSVWKKKIPI